MDEKKTKKTPEIPQLRPDIILPDNTNTEELGTQAVLRMPSPRSDMNREVR